MDASSYNILLFWIFVFCFNVCNIVNGKLCYTTNEKSITNGHISVYSKKFFCCDNSEHKDNKCIECKKGFVSAHGEPCKPCPSYKFGRKCSGDCKCEMYESCHNVLGCIFVSTMNDRTEKTVTKSTEKEVTTIKDQTNQDAVKDTLNSVFLYTVCTGSLTLVLVLVTATLTYYRREKRQRNNPQQNIQSANNKGTSTVIIV